MFSLPPWMQFWRSSTDGRRGLNPVSAEQESPLIVPRSPSHKEPMPLIAANIGPVLGHYHFTRVWSARTTLDTGRAPTYYPAVAVRLEMSPEAEDTIGAFRRRLTSESERRVAAVESHPVGAVFIPFERSQDGVFWGSFIVSLLHAIAGRPLEGIDESLLHTFTHVELEGRCLIIEIAGNSPIRFHDGTVNPRHDAAASEAIEAIARALELPPPRIAAAA